MLSVVSCFTTIPRDNLDPNVRYLCSLDINVPFMHSVMSVIQLTRVLIGSGTVCLKFIAECHSHKTEWPTHMASI